ncbi:MAG: RND transporter, partial [Sphingobacteriia bacterium]
MWYRLGQWILANRMGSLAVLFLVTLFMGWKASQVQLSYDFTRALPTDNPKYQAYQAFLKQFGSDGNTVVIGVETKQFFDQTFFNAVDSLHKTLLAVPGVTNVLSVPVALNLVNDTLAQQLKAVRIFTPPYADQAALDSARDIFTNLPFYRSLLYNPEKDAYLMGVGVQKDSINSKYRSVIIGNIQQAMTQFEKQLNTTTH